MIFEGPSRSVCNSSNSITRGGTGPALSRRLPPTLKAEQHVTASSSDRWDT